jgi:hypothetical protein
MVSRGSALVRKVLPGLFVALAVVLSGCVVDVGDESTGEPDGVGQSPLNEQIALPDPDVPGDLGAGQDPEPDPWKGGRITTNTDPEPDPWHPTMTAAKGSGSSNNKP